MPRDPASLVIDRPEDFRVHSDAYTSPEIFELEMRRIFERSWVYVAHESQLASAGDFVTTRIGTQPVIVSRGRDGGIHVLLNRCRHRASIVCRLPEGRSQQFVCPYHSWTYGLDGALLNVAQKEGYGDMDRGPLALQHASAVGTYRGLVFARLSGDGETLDERLRHVRDYVDLWVERSPAARIRVTRAAHRLTYAGNWKFQMENGVDGYHGNYVHSSFIRIADRAGERKASAFAAVRETGGTIGLPRGDGLIERPHGGMAGQFDYAHPGHADYHAALDAAYGPERRQDILAQRNILIFPNLFLFESHLRVIQPVSVSETIVTMLPTILDGVRDEMNAARLRSHERFFGPAGFGTPDDVEMFVNCENGMRARGVEWVRLHRGLHRERSGA
ncbi:MAG TPA: Rieske 2Fe-2S domain-containing protein [Vicinamibacterales bacterium]|nr:Rieske 2Fe-2S domain-containing protein [Vicinamibacterales bacterium]